MANEKTIKQLADELGVSKQAVWQKIKRNKSTDLRQLMIKKGNTVYVLTKGQTIIKSMFNDMSNGKRKSVGDNKDVNVDDDVDEIVFLRNLVNDLQNEKKELYKLLDQQQILTLQANKKIEELELKNDEQTEKEEDESVSTQNYEVNEAQTKKSFWAKLFGK